MTTPLGSRDQVFLASFGTPAPMLAIDPIQPEPQLDLDHPSPSAWPQQVNAGVQSASNDMGYYIGINPTIWKSYVAVPTNQGARAGVAQRQGPMYGNVGIPTPRNNPARMQFSEGYTYPLQFYPALNTWNNPSGLNSKADRLSQPSTRAVSPFATVPIPTRMPWDL